MSFILDALKKSEAERQRQAGPALLEMRVVAPRRRWPLWALVVGVLLIVNVLILAWFALRSTTTAGRGPMNTTTAAAPPAAITAAAAKAVTAAMAPATGGHMRPGPRSLRLLARPIHTPRPLRATTRPILSRL